MSTADAATQAVKVPPHSVEAEQSLLGALMLDANAWDKVVGQVDKADFYRVDHQVLFAAIAELARFDKPCDLVTLTDALERTDRLAKAGGETYLYQLINQTAGASNVLAYAQIVRERSVLRQLLTVSADIAEMVYSRGSEPSADLLDRAESKIYQIAEGHGRSQTGPEALHHVLSRATDRLDALCQAGGSITGVETGFSDLDQMTSGLQPGDLVVVAGRPSMGKTAFAMNVAEHAAIKSGSPVVVFSMEMPAESLAMRMMSSLGRINQHKVRTGQLSDDDWPRVSSAVSMLSEAAMFIDDTPALTPGELRARARRVARSHGQLGLVVVDYLQLMRVPSAQQNRTMEITEISRSLKALAKELSVPVVALSQLNRSLEQRQDKRPVMSDLRESGAIEQDADVIAFIYRDEVYHEESTDKGIAEIIIGKQRNGPIGKVKLTFLGEFTRFENFSPEQAMAHYA